MPEHIDEMEWRQAQIVYAVFAAVGGGIGDDWLAAYSTRERALGFLVAQDPQLRGCLAVWEIELGRHPSDAYWAKPGMTVTVDALAGPPEDVPPRDRATLGTMLVSIARDAGGLTVAEAERFDRHSAARDCVNKRIDHRACLAGGGGRRTSSCATRAAKRSRGLR